MMKLADIRDLKSRASDGVWVQAPLGASIILRAWSELVDTKYSKYFLCRFESYCPHFQASVAQLAEAQDLGS